MCRRVDRVGVASAYAVTGGPWRDEPFLAQQFATVASEDW